MPLSKRIQTEPRNPSPGSSYFNTFAALVQCHHQHSDTDGVKMYSHCQRVSRIVLS